jgi:hypothetical protein
MSPGSPFPFAPLRVRVHPGLFSDVPSGNLSAWADEACCSRVGSFQGRSFDSAGAKNRTCSALDDTSFIYGLQDMPMPIQARGRCEGLGVIRM